MWLKKKVVRYAGVIGLSLVSLQSSAGETEALIEGFAKWQAGRVEKILLDQVFDDITENRYVSAYFPDTKENIQSYDLSSTMSLIPLIEFYVDQDIKRMQLILDACIPKNLKTWSDASLDISVRADNAVALFEGLVDVARVGPVKDGVIRTTKNFIDDVCKGTSLGEKEGFSSDDFGRVVGVAEDLLKVIKKPDNHDKSFELSVKPIPKNVEEFLDENYLESFAKAIMTFKKNSEGTDSNVVIVHQVVNLLEQLGKISESNHHNFSRLKSAALFFASLADASASEEDAADKVKGVLETFVDDQDAYRRKRIDNAFYSVFEVNAKAGDGSTSVREVHDSTCFSRVLFCNDSVFLASYFGVSGIKMAESASEDRGAHYRAFGPVGLEFKLLTYKSRPLTLGIAPIDIGNYVTNELKDEEYDAEFDDIVAPSIFLSYSMSSRPVSLLLGYQKGIKVDDDFETEGPFLSVAFDLPIFTLY